MARNVTCISLVQVLNLLLLLVVGTFMMYQMKLTSKRELADKETSHGNIRQKRNAPSDKTDMGLVYTQWGRSNCTHPDVQTVYSGVVGGSFYDHTGGGSDYLCMPPDPNWANFIPAVVNHAMVYGAEFELEGLTNFPFHGRHDKLHDHNVPCAVCEVAMRSKLLMIPAKTKCYDGWTEEYHGYLMTAHHAHKGRTEYTCMDADPDRDPAGYRNENGGLFYTVEGVCGSLPCPPYEDGKELTCVVCTK